MNNKLVSLKVDGVTRHNKSFLGINVQYMLENIMDLRIKTLAIFELTQRHTAVYLKDTVSIKYIIVNFSFDVLLFYYKV